MKENSARTPMIEGDSLILCSFLRPSALDFPPFIPIFPDPLRFFLIGRAALASLFHVIESLRRGIALCLSSQANENRGGFGVASWQG
jgi:hypothetical protein